MTLDCLFTLFSARRLPCDITACLLIYPVLPAACPDSLPGIVIDSAFSTIHLLLVFDPFLYDYEYLIKLHMDLSESAAPLQKTSPDHDPAAVHRLSTELSSQASVLAVHQQQLTRLTSVEELVKTLQSMRMTHAEARPPLTTLPAAVAPIQNATSSPRLVFPEKYDGSPARCTGFLLQCFGQSSYSSLDSFLQLPIFYFRFLTRRGR